MTDPTPPAAEERLPPYSGEDVTCGKCANVGAYTSHRAAGEHSSNEAPTWGRSPKGERLERSCFRCNFIWDEALVRPVDELDEQLAAWLREQIANALRTTPTSGHVHKPGEERYDHHPKNEAERGHTYTYTCALCTRDVDALTAAVVDVVSLAVINLPAMDPTGAIS
ncbi:hypothetical protein [Streptomyces atratus]|uniref:Uncharacterized protein n=1 Tax=Streptomyces atratus TaxID=1893 RepID=A0A2Z5J6V1_STRAR|nr:hypothetical protein [Streptomyces atratus]AXE76054.1 hypothetical protein C5746_02690 [Streptomyces atratus]